MSEHGNLGEKMQIIWLNKLFFLELNGKMHLKQPTEYGEYFTTLASAEVY